MTDNEKQPYGFGEAVYKDGPTIPAVFFGDGSIAVTPIGPDSCGFVGVALGEFKGSKVAVGDVETPKIPVEQFWKQTKQVLLFDNPKSIDVFIETLQDVSQTFGPF